MKKIRGNYVSLKRVIVSVGLVIAAISFSAPSHASLIFDFSFNTGADDLLVEGTIEGLMLGDDGVAATEVVLDDLASGINFAQFANVNAFSVDDDGNITSFAFFANASPVDGLTSSLFFSSIMLNSLGTPPGVGFAISPDTIDLTASAPIFSRSAPTQVLEPSQLALLGAGVMAFGVARRKKRKVVE